MDDEKHNVINDLFTTLDMEIEAFNEWMSEIENNKMLALLMGFLSVYN